MIVHSWRDELDFRLGHLSLTPPQGSILSSIAGDLEGMARSYLSDGDHFLSTGDPVNALASWAYALGWIDAGACLGLFVSEVQDPGWIFFSIPPATGDAAHLREKTGRYQSLLFSAITSVVPAPEQKTGMYRASKRFLMASAVSREFGRFFCTMGRLHNALGSYSYGHAWLDTGVRAGLFRVAGSREIFAI